MSSGPDANVDPAELLPYGHPALQIDRVLSHEPGRLRAVKSVSYHELGYHLGGPRTGRFPASLALESFLQACGILLALEDEHSVGDRVLVFGSARGVRVRGAVRAGELLVHAVELIDRDDDTAEFGGTAHTGDGTEVLAVERAIVLLRTAELLTRPN